MIYIHVLCGEEGFLHVSLLEINNVIKVCEDISEI